MNFLMRVGCIAVYALGIGGAIGLLPSPWAGRAQALGMFVLAAHTVELIIFLKYLRLHPGSAFESALLALLFGSLHWVPLLRIQRSSEAKKSGGG